MGVVLTRLWLLRMGQGGLVLGIVKFFKADKGWGVLVSDKLPSDVWVHFSVLEMDGFRQLDAGDVVEFDVEAVKQDSFEYRATRAGLLGHGPALALRRIEGRVVVADQEQVTALLLPHRSRADA